MSDAGGLSTQKGNKGWGHNTQASGLGGGEGRGESFVGECKRDHTSPRFWEILRRPVAAIITSNIPPSTRLLWNEEIFIEISKAFDKVVIS